MRLIHVIRSSGWLPAVLLLSMAPLGAIVRAESAQADPDKMWLEFRDVPLAEFVEVVANFLQQPVRTTAPLIGRITVLCEEASTRPQARVFLGQALELKGYLLTETPRGELWIGAREVAP